MRAEVALFGGMILGVDEDRVVRARRDARLAADADVLVEVDDAVGAAEHRRGGAGGDAGRMFALIAAGDLEGAARGRELADVDVLDVGAIDAEGDGVLRLARSAAGVAADAASLIDDLPPLHRFGHRGEVITGTLR